MNEKNLFDRTKIRTLPLSCRENKSGLNVIIDPNKLPDQSKNLEKIIYTAGKIIEAKKNNKPIILTFGAHLIKNGLSLVISDLIRNKYLTHLASNGASCIHDWEFAYQGKTEEDVRKYVSEGQFGIWEETNKFINLALIAGAGENKGYGVSICEMIHKDKIEIPEKILDTAKKKLIRYGIKSEDTIEVKHLYKKYSFQNVVFEENINFTVHPHLGHDIIYNHQLNDMASIGICAEIDYLNFAEAVSNLEGGGVYLSVGSSIMSPMVFEKSLSMARNVVHQSGKRIKDFSIIVNDIQEGEWKWGSGIEPNKDSPVYYQRFCKTFDRMGAKEMIYIKEDNRTFLTNLYHELKNMIT
ncbi:MAG: hypothetical protein AABW83_00510 [Nanoarchaeota archaeon]